MRRETFATMAQMTIPQAVGIKNESAVHLKLPVSFLIVRQVVAHGKCMREKSMVHTAVTQVHPFASSSVRSSARFDRSIRLPVDK